MREGDSSDAQARGGSRALLVVLAVCAVTLFTNAYLTVDLDSESRALSSIVAEYVQHGRFEYPMHAQPLLFSGIRSFILHPPLKYLLCAGVVKLFGYGVWQLHAIGYLSGLVVLFALSRLLSHSYGRNTALWIWVLAATWQVFYEAALAVRPDFLVGVWLTVVIVASGRLWLTDLSSRAYWRWSVVLGATTALGVASHWNGAWLLGYLPVHLWLSRAKNPVATFLALSLGVGCIAIPWLVFLQGDLIRGVYLNATSTAPARIEGSAGYRGIAHYMLPLSSWRGGRLVFICAVVGVLACLSSFATTLRERGMPEDPSRRFDLLLLGHLALFLPFAWLIRHSLQAAYLANVIPLVLVFAARGTGLVVARVTHLVGQERRIGLVSCGLAIALLAASPQVDKHDSFSARNVFLGDTHRRDIRTGLQELIPDTSPLLLGGFAFPYLHDVQYVSFWQIVAEVGQQILGRLEIDRGRGYLWVPLESLGLLQVPRPSRGPEMARLSDGVVLSDHSYWWQWDFLDARVWSADYVHVGTVFAFGQFGHQVFAKRTVPARSLAPGLYRAGTAWVLNYGYHQDPSAIAMMRLSEWRCLSEIEQYQCVEAFLVEQHMLNLIRQNTAEEESLYRAVYDRWRAAAQRSEAEGFERTLMQAFSWEQDSAMETLMRTRGVAQLGR